MSGADYRQQQEEEELFQWAECQGINAHEFVDGQAFAKHKRPIPIGSSESFRRGYNAQLGLEDVCGK
jgi:hypothetical protein